jgi:hypothetical protein
VTTPRAEIEEWYRRAKEELYAQTPDEFQLKLTDYFTKAGLSPPSGKNLQRLTNIASDQHLIKQVGVFRRIVRFFRGLLR